MRAKITDGQLTPSRPNPPAGPHASARVGSAKTEADKPDGRRARGLLRREAILKAAQDLFIRDGYRRTTLEGIIVRSGGSRETVYSLFGGKHGLLGAIVEEVGESFVAHLLEPTRLELPPHEVLTELGLRLLTIWNSLEGRAIHRMVLSEGLESPEIMQAWYRGGMERVLNALSRYLEIQSRAGRLVVVDDPVMMARQFQFLLMGEAAFPVISGSAELMDAKAAVARTVTLLLRAHGVDRQCSSGEGKPI